jgi:hypothetical protein
MERPWPNLIFYPGSYLDVKIKITIKLRRVDIPTGIRYKHTLIMSAKLVIELS